MTYELENVLQDDRNKIANDAGNLPQLVARFSKWGVLNNPEHSFIWAIDRDAGNYLFRSPSFVREMDNEYHLFYEGSWFVISYSKFSGKPNNVSVFTHSYSDIDDVPAEMKKVLRHIFSIYGLHGYGPDGSSGNEVGWYRIVPTFKDEV